MTVDTPLDDPREHDAVWSTARPDDLRRIADLARRLFSAAAVTILSADGQVRHRTGEPAPDAVLHEAPLLGEDGALRVGTLQVHGKTEWNDGDRATLGDMAACLCSLVESRHIAARRDGAARAAPPPPFHPDEPMPAAPTDGTGGGEGWSGEVGARILLADDLDLNRKLISDMLSIDGHAVDSVSDGEAAVQAAGERAYDLILMDMIMPGMDGMAATRAIRALPSPACEVPIVALTAYSLPDQLDSCMAAGVDAVLIKPMSVAALSEAIATWSGKRRAA